MKFNDLCNENNVQRICIPYHLYKWPDHVEILKNTPNLYNIKYEDVYVNVKEIKCHGWFIESNKKNSISKDKVILSTKTNCMLAKIHLL